MSEGMSEDRKFVSFRSVIELWATRGSMASEIPGTTDSLISKWWQRNRIPDEWWMAILATEKASGAGLTADILAELAARSRPEVALAEARA